MATSLLIIRSHTPSNARALFMLLFRETMSGWLTFSKPTCSRGTPQKKTDMTVCWCKSFYPNKLWINKPHCTHLFSKEMMAAINAEEPTWKTNQLFSEGDVLLMFSFLEFPSQPYNRGQTKTACLVN